MDKQTSDYVLMVLLDVVDQLAIDDRDRLFIFKLLRDGFMGVEDNVEKEQSRTRRM